MAKKALGEQALQEEVKDVGRLKKYSAKFLARVNK